MEEKEIHHHGEAVQGHCRAANESHDSQLSPLHVQHTHLVPDDQNLRRQTFDESQPDEATHTEQQTSRHHFEQVISSYHTSLSENVLKDDFLDQLAQQGIPREIIWDEFLRLYPKKGDRKVLNESESSKKKRSFKRKRQKRKVDIQEKIRRSVLRQYEKTQLIVEKELEIYAQGCSNPSSTKSETHAQYEEDDCNTLGKYFPSFPSNYRDLAPVLLENHVQIPMNWTEVLCDPLVSCLIFCDGDQVVPEFDICVPPDIRLFFVYSASLNIPATTVVCESILKKRLLPMCVGSGKEMADNLIATLLCEAHYEAKKDVMFKVLSADRGFDMIISNARLKKRNAKRINFRERFSLSTLLQTC